MKILNILVMTAVAFCCCSKGGENAAEPQPETIEDTTQQIMNQEIKISINGQSRIVTLAENSATNELAKKLQNGAITYNADDYGGFEKVGALGFSLTADDTRITTNPGDIMLYNGSQLVIFYASNTWNYTPIGKINDATADELKDFLNAGEGSVAITLTL